MSTRDELAMSIAGVAHFPPSNRYRQANEIADALIAEGWRKKPSREEIAEALERNDPDGGAFPDEGEPEFSYWYDQADAILALMDRGQ